MPNSGSLSAVSLTTGGFRNSRRRAKKVNGGRFRSVIGSRESRSRRREAPEVLFPFQLIPTRSEFGSRTESDIPFPFPYVSREWKSGMEIEPLLWGFPFQGWPVGERVVRANST